MTRVCPSCQSLTEVGSVEPSSVRCPACGGLTPEVDLGVPLLDGSAACPVAFGPYRVLGLIGKGGMGLVYQARHESTGAEVAVKTVRVRERGMLHRIRREIQALARIKHPGLVRIIETGQSEGLPWYAMELLRGESLQNRLHAIRKKRAASLLERQKWANAKETRVDFILDLDTGPIAPEFEGVAEKATVGLDADARFVARDQPTLGEIPPESGITLIQGFAEATDDDSSSLFPPSPPTHRPVEIDPVELGPIEDEDLRDFLRLMARFCETLEYLHAEGIVHRDIKPQNVIIKEDGSPVLLDFGLASYFGAEGRESLEVLGKTEGTPEYMSPEQIRGEYVDARADLYSVGCILYEGLTGVVPFRANDPRTVLKGHVQLAPTPPRELEANVPGPLNNLVLGLLAKNAGDRPGYARDILTVIEKLGCSPIDRSANRPSRDYLYRAGFVGRSQTLANLEAHVRRVLARPGHCLFLRGRSGVGKTRFIMELARRFERSGMTVVSGECLPIGIEGDEGPTVRATPLHPFRLFLQMVVDCCVEGGCEAVARLIGTEGAVLAECEPSVASLPNLVEAPCPDDEAEGALQARLIEALGRTLEEFARKSPVVLFIDDLQWADTLTLHFLALFHVGVWDSPNVAIVASFRTEDSDSAIKGYLPVFRDATFIDLGPLEEPCLGAIVHDMLGSNQAEPRFVSHLAHRSEGNPFFVAEYLRAAVAEGWLARDETGCWRPRGDHSGLDADSFDASIPLPASLNDLVIRRLSGLSDDARTLLELASTIGRRMDAELLEVVGLLGETRTLMAVEALLVAQVLEEDHDGHYRFTHDKLREIAYEQIAPSRRRTWHRSVALTLETRFARPEERSRQSATLAHHWYRSIGDRHSESEAVDRAIAYLQSSTRQVLHAGLPAEAVDFGRAAARLLGVRLPKRPEAIAGALDAELTRIRDLLGGRTPVDLRDLPDSTHLAANRSIELLVSIQPPAFLSNQLDLFALMASKNLSMTLENGLGPLAPSVFALYSLVERIVLDDARAASAYASLAVEIDRRTGQTQRADVLFLKGWFVDHWIAPLREIAADCDLGARAGLAAGEILYGSYNHGATLYFLAASGEPLPKVIAEADARLAQIGRRVIVARFHGLLERQFARALAGLTESTTSLTDDQYDEARDLAFICGTTNATQIGFYHATRLKLCYYQREFREALQQADLAASAAGHFARQPAEIDLVFFQALASLGMAGEDPAFLEIAKRNRAFLAGWRIDSETNFAPKVWLVEAEIARVEGRDQEARSLYQEAIRSASAGAFPHQAALAQELAARHLVVMGEDPSMLFQAAIEGYRAWGATTLVDRLTKERERDPLLIPDRL